MREMISIPLARNGGTDGNLHLGEPNIARHSGTITRTSIGRGSHMKPWIFAAATAALAVCGTS
ncbi:MAG TPA: hypothetical protein VF418_14080, partial [Sphingomonadaceae bacterium]